MADVSPYEALTLADADGDGVNESDALGCDLGGVAVNDPQDEIDNGTLDDDFDEVINRDDVCPGTALNLPVDLKGCSTEQRNLIATPSTGSDESLVTGVMMFFMIAGVVLAAGAYFILRNIETEDEDIKNLVNLEEQNLASFDDAVAEGEGWSVPVLDGSSTQAESEPPTTKLTPEQLAQCPGWPEETIQSYLDQGWSMDQLADYYQEQVDQHA